MRCSTAEVAMQFSASLQANSALVPAAQHVQQLTTSLQENCYVINATSLSQYMHASA